MILRVLLILLLAGHSFAILLTPHPSVINNYTSYERQPNDPKKPSNPVILVPGDGGSRLDAKLTGKPSVVHYMVSKSRYYY
jgi:hypothetical protein